MDADYSVDIFAIEVCEDIIIEVKNEGTEGVGVCKKWCIGVMVYFSIKFGSNCTLIHHYTFLDRHPLKLALLLNNNIIYLIILLLK